MRTLLIAALGGLALAGCTNQPKATNEQLQEYKPPEVGVRGDVVPRQQARFERLDKNNDGFVTPDEFPPRFADRLAARDVNKDGKLSRSEMVEGALDRFDGLDTDKDGQITPEERKVGNTAAPAPAADNATGNTH